ncbi:hypothetical protein [Pseudofrankia sp. BMG5.37]|uniref:hypothetical protein n=1 Tax=Pseudofrankia sp. BMG5.37 TaxID=3050035 RepID=UPI0028957C41|nr:hypothetical protein [Pseudofrankia sp. BMG5.37]MDT3438100.1 hypothetical protein [Pseudofrankia sp. BMG5.37]
MRQLGDQLLTSGRSLLRTDDPLEAEMLGAIFASVDEQTDGELLRTVVEKVLPRFARKPSRQALAVTLALRAVAPGPVREALGATADRLAAAGTHLPRWAGDLAEPLTATRFQLLTDEKPTDVVVLTGVFERAGRAHAFLLSADPDDCGAAIDIATMDADEIDGVLDEIRADARADGIELRTTPLTAEDFRWRTENALTARADHDRVELELDLDGEAVHPAGLDLEDDSPFGPFDGEEDLFGPSDDEDLFDEEDEEEDEALYTAAAFLLRARLAILPAPTRPPAPHDTECEASLPVVLDDLASRP